MSRRKAKTLAQRVAEPGVREGVKRARARLDAEEAGWIVLDPKVARALEAVARAARPLVAHYFPRKSIAWEWERTHRALARLSRLRKGGSGRRSRGTGER